MASGGRPGADHLTHLERLAAAPQKQHVFHALRVIEAAHPDKPRLGNARRPRDEAVRFGQDPELAFPPSTVAEFQPPEKKKPGILKTRFFGLFGPQGPLPLHLTEYARDRLRNHRDPTFVAFANMVTHRMMALFFRAWRSGQPAPSFDRGDNDAIERKVGAIAGYNADALRTRDAFPDLAKRHFAGLLSQGPRNAEGLVAILSSFFSAPVHLQQFVGSWLELEPGDRWSLGAPAGLGQTTSIGDKVWSRNAKFRILIGPLTIEEYRRLLPGSQSMERLRAIVRNYVGDALDWDVNLILKADDVPTAELGKSVQLGQVGWIGERKSKDDAADLYVQPMQHGTPAPETKRDEVHD